MKAGVCKKGGVRASGMKSESRVRPDESGHSPASSFHLRWNRHRVTDGTLTGGFTGQSSLLPVSPDCIMRHRRPNISESPVHLRLRSDWGKCHPRYPRTSLCRSGEKGINGSTGMGL